MKVFIVNISSSHPVIDLIRKFSSAAILPEWSDDLLKIYRQKCLVFAKVDDIETFTRINKACEENGQWCFIWADRTLLKSISAEIPSRLIDFISGEYDENEIRIRLIRLLRLKELDQTTNFFDIPQKIADELTKNQIMLFDELYKAGVSGVKKKILASRLWDHPTDQFIQKSGFNVHIHHLRKKLKKYGMFIIYNSKENAYFLKIEESSLNTFKQKDIRELSVAF